MQHIWLCLGLIFTVLGFYTLIAQHNRVLLSPPATNDTAEQIRSNSQSDSQPETINETINLPAKPATQNNPSTIILRPNSRDRVVITIPPGKEVRQNFILDSRTYRKRMIRQNQAIPTEQDRSN